MKKRDISFLVLLLIAVILTAGLVFLIHKRSNHAETVYQEKAAEEFPTEMEQEIIHENEEQPEAVRYALKETLTGPEEEKNTEGEGLQETQVMQTLRPQTASANTNTNKVLVQPDTSSYSSIQETSDPQQAATPAEQTGETEEGISDEFAHEAQAANGGLWENELEIDMG
jgi:hypothetical protein